MRTRTQGNIRNPHNISADRQGNLYVGDRGNRRIQVFDRDGRFQRFLFMNAPYDKQPPARCSETCPRTGPTKRRRGHSASRTRRPQYLYTADSEPGRIYKMTLDGKILGMLGESGRGPKQFNWTHGIACPSENELFVADMNNWRVQKLTLYPDRARTTSSR